MALRRLGALAGEMALPTPQLLQRLAVGSERAALRASMRHFTLRWPTLPQMSRVLSLFGQSATAWAVEPHAWHCAGSGHWPARWPTTRSCCRPLHRRRHRQTLPWPEACLREPRPPPPFEYILPPPLIGPAEKFDSLIISSNAMFISLPPFTFDDGLRDPL